MALCHHKYPPFLGVTSEPQGYDCAHYGAPVYHCVFPVSDSYNTIELADEVLQYQHDLGHSGPVMCLAFDGRGIVCPNDFETRSELIDEIKFVKGLPKQRGDIELSRWPTMRSFMGKPARRPYFMRENIVIYDIDTGLSGRQIAGEALLHFKHLRGQHKIDKLVLRFPNGGSVMVHRYLKKGFNVLHLSTGIQRARKMDVSEAVVAKAA